MALKDELYALDHKNHNYYDNLSDEDKKKFSGYLMLRYASSVKGASELEAYYLIAANKRTNLHFWSLSKHPKLQWLICTTASPGIGIQFHQWIPFKKKEASSSNKALKFLKHLNPNLKDDELELLAELNDEKTCKEHAKSLGWQENEIKSFFK
jgi:hypothetical protein